MGPLCLGMDDVEPFPYGRGPGSRGGFHSCPVFARGGIARFGKFGTRPDAMLGPIMTDQGYTLFDTAIGRCAIAWTAHGVAGLQLPEASDAATRARLRRRHAG